MSEANRNSDSSCIPDITKLEERIELIQVTFVHNILTVYPQSGRRKLQTDLQLFNTFVSYWYGCDNSYNMC